MSIFEGLWADARSAVRATRGSRGFVVAVVLTVGPAIAAALVLSAVVDALVFRAFPGPHGDRLVALAHQVPSSGLTARLLSIEDVDDIRRHSQILESVAFYRVPKEEELGDSGSGQDVVACRVSFNFFDVFGVPPILGRTFEPRDGEPGGERVAILSHAFWTRSFGANPRILGSNVRVGGQAYHVIGVMPKRFGVPRGTDVWLADDQAGASQPGSRLLSAIGLIAPNSSIAEATQWLTGISAHRPAPDGSPLRVSAASLREELVGPAGRAATLLTIVVLGLMAIGCLNVATLQLSRRSTRKREFGSRAALGASPRRLGRQAWLEAALIGLGGSVIGLLMAVPALALVRAWGMGVVPALDEARFGAETLFLAIVAVGLVTLVAGLPLATLCRQSTILDSIRGVHQGQSGRRAGAWRIRGAGALVVGQVGLAVVLVVAATLCLRSLTRLLTTDLGFEPAGVVGVQLAPERRLDASHVFTDRFLEDLRHVPGVAAAAATSLTLRPGSPLRSGLYPIAALTQAGDWKPYPAATYQVVSDDFFVTLGVPVISGRVFDRHDKSGAPCTVVINEILAAAWPSGAAIGQRIDTAVSLSGSPSGHQNICTVIGVVGNTRFELGSAPGPQLYFSYRFRTARMSFVVRAVDQRTTVLPAIRARAGAIDPNREIVWAGPWSDLLGDAVIAPRFYALLFGAFALVALTLTAVGLYGTINDAVVNRRREIGIRLALGARPNGILLGIVAQALILVGAGLAMGTLAASTVTRGLESLLFEIGSGDPGSFAAAWIALVTVALFGALGPARRAARIDPADLLRVE